MSPKTLPRSDHAGPAIRVAVAAISVRSSGSNALTQMPPNPLLLPEYCPVLQSLLSRACPSFFFENPHASLMTFKSCFRVFFFWRGGHNWQFRVCYSLCAQGSLLLVLSRSYGVARSKLSGPNASALTAILSWADGVLMLSEPRTQHGQPQEAKKEARSGKTQEGPLEQCLEI